MTEPSGEHSGGASESDPGRRAGGNSDELVRVEVGDAVATLTLDSPANRNALGSALTGQLHAALQAAARGVQRALGSLLRTGSLEEALGDMVGWEERQRLVRKPHFDELERLYTATERAVPTH